MKRGLLLLIGPMAAAFAAVAAGVAPAHASPSPSPSPSAPPVQFVEITGEGLEAAIVLSSERHPRRQSAMRDEVQWLAAEKVFAPPPGPDIDLGPKYTLVLLTMGEPTDRFDLFPLAPGGPRVFRPAQQPGDRKVAEGWFYGRLSMPTSLLGAGVPLGGVTPAPGGQGGGFTASAAPDFTQVLGDWRRFVGINTAAVIIIAAGVFGLAYLLRRRI